MKNEEAVKVECHCPACNMETSHIQLLLQKPSEYGTSKKEQVKAFVSGFISGSASPVLASLELLDRHLICEKCGVRRVENEGQELE